MKILTLKGTPVLDRFESAYSPEPNSGCWLWMNSLTSDGYGKIRHDGKRSPVHRFSYELHKGPVPKGLCVRHTCDTPYCVNPDHLIVGTWGDNNRDRKARGRNGNRWRGSCKRNHDLSEHGYYRSNGTRYCGTCQGVTPNAHKYGG